MDNATFQALKAWHGSPHDFDQFMDKAIGTGEGTRAPGRGGGFGAYGHGHYTTETRGIGEEYMRNLSYRHDTGAGREYKIDGIPSSSLRPWVEDRFSLLSKQRALARREADYKLDAKNAIEAGQRPDGDKEAQVEEDREWLKSEEEHLQHGAEALGIPQDLRTLDNYDSQLFHEISGHIAHDRLDPFKAVHRAVDRLALANEKYDNGGYDGFLEFHGPTGDVEERRARMLSIFDPSRVEVDNTPEPGRLYELSLKLDPEHLLDWDDFIENHHPDVQHKLAHHLAQVYGNEDPGAQEVEDIKEEESFLGKSGEGIYKLMSEEYGAPEASKRLLESGIHGIRYRDGSSRRKKMGTELLVDGAPVESWDASDPQHLAKAQDSSNIQAANDFYISSNIAHNFSQLSKKYKDIDEAIADFRDSEDAREKVMKGRRPMIGDPNGEGKYEPGFGKSAADWLEANRHRVTLREKRPSYNYVVFDPKLIEVVRKYGRRGEVLKDYGHGVTLREVDHDPFAGT